MRRKSEQESLIQFCSINKKETGTHVVMQLKQTESFSALRLSCLDFLSTKSLLALFELFFSESVVPAFFLEMPACSKTRHLGDQCPHPEAQQPATCGSTAKFMPQHHKSHKQKMCFGDIWAVGKSSFSGASADNNIKPKQSKMDLRS